jgi:hypothetical protein
MLITTRAFRGLMRWKLALALLIIAGIPLNNSCRFGRDESRRPKGLFRWLGRRHHWFDVNVAWRVCWMSV